MLSTYKSPTNLEIYINNAFKAYKNNIVSNFLGEIKDEQLKGESCKQYNFSFYLALYLVTLVYKDVIKYPNKNWNYFVTKYKLKEYKKCLSCSGINLNNILFSFNLPSIIEQSGIEDLEVEETLEVEPLDLTVTTSTTITVNLNTILNTTGCITDLSERLLDRTPPVIDGGREEIGLPPHERRRV